MINFFLCFLNDSAFITPVLEVASRSYIRRREFSDLITTGRTSRIISVLALLPRTPEDRAMPLFTALLNDLDGTADNTANRPREIE
jgi:hypothetical protein